LTFCFEPVSTGFPPLAAINHAIYRVVRVELINKARFNVLLSDGLSHRTKDVKTPFSKLLIADHAINDVADCRQRRKDG